jgi:hypothetical protein
MAACSGTTGGGSSSTAGATGTGGGTGSGGGSSGGGSSTGASNCGGNGNACSSLANGASVTYVVQIASVAPDPAGGGAPPDGTYFLTSASTYTGEGGAKGKTTESRQDTIQISGSGTELNQASNNDSCPQTATGSLSFGTTQVTLTATCPTGQGQGGTIGYTSSTSTLTLFIPSQSPGGSQVLEVQVYTLQQ